MSLWEGKSIRLDESYVCVGVCGSLYNRAKLDHVAQKRGGKHISVPDDAGRWFCGRVSNLI